MIPRAIAFACLVLTARLAQAQDAQAIQVHAGPTAAVIVIIARDSAWVSMSTAPGYAFVVRTDTATMATWADNADLLRGPTGDSAKPNYAGVKLASANRRLGRTQSITFIRLSADSNSAYRVTGEDSTQTMSLVLPADSIRIVFNAMRREAQQAMASRMILADPSFSIARLRHLPAPHYPESLRQSRVEGEVLLAFIIDSTGHVDRRTIEVMYTADPAFTSAAEDALLHAEFDPAEAQGHHIAFRTTQRFTFKLQ